MAVDVDAILPPQDEGDRPPPGRSAWRRLAFWLPSSASTADRRREEPGTRLAKARLSERIIFGKVGPRQVSSFCRQFASYLDAGVTLVTALESLRVQFTGTPLGPIIGRIALSVRRGGTLTEVIVREPAAFDRFFCTMMKIAEARGGVPETLRLLADHYMARQRLIRQARSALIYPAIVLVIAFAVTALLTILVLPRIVAIMQDLLRTRSGRIRKFSLPWPTRVLIDVSDFIQHIGWWLIPAVSIGLLVFFFAMYKSRRGRPILEEFILFIPVVGSLARKIDTSRLSRTLASVLGAGVDIGLSLELASEVMMFIPMRRAVLRAREAVLVGETLGTGLGATHRFPIELVSVVHSGEETGRLPEILLPLANDYEEQIEYAVRDLGNLIQPIILLGLGSVISFILIAFVLAYTTLLGKLSGGG